MNSDLLVCPICGGDAVSVTEPREISYGRRRITVDDEFVRCKDCGERYYVGDQMDATDRKAAEKARLAHESPLPFEIRRLRASLRLSQSAFERLLGVGPKTAVRWERGSVTPNAATGALLRIIEAVPQAALFLAGLNDVVLPEAYVDGMAGKRVMTADKQEFTVPLPRADVIPIGPYLDRSAGMQRVAAPLSSAVSTLRESTG